MPNMHLFMAIATMIVVPVLIIFILLQRYFVEGVQLTGLKG
jgi:multiple sugar transport system permease protein